MEAETTFPDEAGATIIAGRSTAQRINAERLMVLAWSRAILLQIAHPLVAAGVAEHSTFRGGTIEAARRLHHTIAAMRALTFGDVPSQAAALAGIRAIHRRVNGKLREAAGPFAAGTPYSAEDPALVLWVHATLVESLVLAFDAIVAPLELRDRDAFCTESAPTAIDLKADPAAVPESWAAMQTYIQRTHESGVLVVSREARELAGAVLSPRLANLVWPFGVMNRRLTAGWLPPAIRDQYQLPWGAREDRAFHRDVRWLHSLRRVLPKSIAWWPEARLR